MLIGMGGFINPAFIYEYPVTTAGCNITESVLLSNLTSPIYDPSTWDPQSHFRYGSLYKNTSWPGETKSLLEKLTIWIFANNMDILAKILTKFQTVHMMFKYEKLYFTMNKNLTHKAKYLFLPTFLNQNSVRYKYVNHKVILDCPLLVFLSCDRFLCAYVVREHILSSKLHYIILSSPCVIAGGRERAYVMSNERNCWYLWGM